MITFLSGKLASSLPDRAVVDVNGVGYECFIPMSTFDALPAMGDRVHLLTHFHVREQEQSLYGFATSEERDLFRLLIDRVSGIGPKMALSVLSGMAVSDFKTNVIAADAATLSKIKGVGKKTAERIIVELKDKVGVTDAWVEARQRTHMTRAQAMGNDVVLALINLGYKQVEAQKAVKEALASGGLGAEPADADWLRAALRLLNS